MNDITGQKWNRLTAVRLAGRDNHGRQRWEFLCDCGNTQIADRYSVVSGKAKSCGCHRKKTSAARSTIHGKSNTKEWLAWRNMLVRCYDPTHNQYANYGGRGVTVCERWRDTFGAFFQDMGLAPSRGHSVDRINVDAPYAPDNCRWATQREQQNNRRNNVVIEHNGKRQTLAAWSRETGLNAQTIRWRMKHDWPIEQALSV